MTALCALLSNCLIAHHAPAEDRAFVRAAEHPGPFKFREELFHFFERRSHHSGKSFRPEILSIQPEVTVGFSLMHEGEHVNPETTGTQ